MVCLMFHHLNINRMVNKSVPHVLIESVKEGKDTKIVLNFLKLDEVVKIPFSVEGVRELLPKIADILSQLDWDISRDEVGEKHRKVFKEVWYLCSQ